MAVAVWEGQSPAAAQIHTILVSLTWATGDTATITCGAQSVTFTVAAVETVTAVVAGLVALWNASTAGELTQVTAADNDPTITLTADTAGVPFTVTTSEVTAGDGILGDPAVTTANAGPNCWDTAENWSTGAVPQNGDDVVFENSSTNCLYGLAQANTIATLTSDASFTGNLGLPRNNAEGYVEYQAMALACATAITSIKIGQGEGDGSSRIKLAVGNLTAALAIDIYKSGTRAETGIPAILITTGTQANDTTLTVNRGDVGVAFFASETAVVDVLNVGFINRTASDAEVMIGSGVTLTTTTMIGGDVRISANSTTVTQSAGTLVIDGTATVTTLNVRGGNCYYGSSGTAATINLNGGAVLDFRRDGRARTVTNLNIYEGGSIFDPAATVTWTNGLDLEECGLEDVTLQIGEHRTWTPSAI